jgi:hypothetical protein
MRQYELAKLRSVREHVAPESTEEMAFEELPSEEVLASHNSSGHNGLVPLAASAR